jgi:hypothetical protein
MAQGKRIADFLRGQIVLLKPQREDGVEVVDMSSVFKSETLET